MLKVEGVSAAYGAIQVLHDISIDVGPGEAVAILGPNGAGKTTLLRTIAGFLKPRTGRITFDGRDITGIRPEAFVRAGVGQVLEGRQLFGPLTVVENLRLGAYTRYGRSNRGAIDTDIDRVYQLFPRLRERRDQRAATLSGGEQMMLAVGRAIMCKPRLLLLDEPSVGLAPLLVKAIFDALQALRDDGITLLVVEQNPEGAFAVAARCYVLEVGRIVHSGTTEALRASRDLARYYLGTHGEGDDKDDAGA
jgi:branched-chain amino acid transport system ATP-binding protein